MHYFIDGYNLIFRLLHEEEDLQSKREAIIHDLNQKISLLRIDASIVFDATSQLGDGTRTHYDQLEILFTAEGETADEYIMEEIRNHPHPQQETVVTSDKRLAWRVRNRSAHTESVEEFTFWLNRAYKNKQRQLKKGKQIPPISPPKPKVSSKNSLPVQGASLEACEDYYAQIFESKWEEIVKKEEAKKSDALLSASKKRTPRTPKQKRPDPFEAPLSNEERAESEQERWEKIFEKRLNS